MDLHNTKAQIDYLFINKKWKNSAISCKAYSSRVCPLTTELSRPKYDWAYKETPHEQQSPNTMTDVTWGRK